jgi:uncharacterized protein (DUF362 family)
MPGMDGLSRRAFLKGLGLAAAAGAFGLPGGPSPGQAGRIRVVSVTDGAVWSGAGWTDADLDAGALRSMLVRTLTELTETSDANAALGSLLPGLGPATRIAIKVNAVNAYLPSHPKLVLALAGLLVEAGASADNITLFDRSDAELSRCGYAVNAAAGLKVHGSDHPGVGMAAEPVALSETSVRLSRILTERCDHLISLPVLKNHPMAGATLSLKNQLGSIDFPENLHGARNDGSPGIADLNARPEIKDKLRLALIDGLFGTYISGLHTRPDFAPMTLISSRDPVAADAVGQALINARRVKENQDPVDAKHLKDAARLGVGNNDLSAIDQVAITLNPVVEKSKPWDAGSGCRSAGSGSCILGAAAVAGALLRYGSK